MKSYDSEPLPQTGRLKLLWVVRLIHFISFIFLKCNFLSFFCVMFYMLTFSQHHTDDENGNREAIHSPYFLFFNRKVEALKILKKYFHKRKRIFSVSARVWGWMKRAIKFERREREKRIVLVKCEWILLLWSWLDSKSINFDSSLLRK